MSDGLLETARQAHPTNTRRGGLDLFVRGSQLIDGMEDGPEKRAAAARLLQETNLYLRTLSESQKKPPTEGLKIPE